MPKCYWLSHTGSCFSCEVMFDRGCRFQSQKVFQSLYIDQQKFFFKQYFFLMNSEDSDIKKFIFELTSRKEAILVLANKEMSPQEMLDSDAFAVEDPESFKSASFAFSKQDILSPQHSCKDTDQINHLLKDRTNKREQLKQGLEKPDASQAAQEAQLDQYLFVYRSNIQLQKVCELAQMKFENYEEDLANNADLQTYLKLFLKKLLLCEKIPQKEAEKLSQQILRYGTIFVLKKSQNISQDTFNKLERIISNCKSYKAFIQFGDKDYKGLKNLVKQGIFSILDSTPENNLRIYQQLLKEPLCHAIALNQQLTNAQKAKYYKSVFYQSGLLKDYAKVVHYAESDQKQAKKQRDELLKQLLMNTGHLSPEIIDDVLNFNFEELLKNQFIFNIKEKVYSCLKNKSHYYKACMKKYNYSHMNEGPIETTLIDLKFAIRQKFLDINLQYESWKDAQAALQNRSYSYIDKLQLTMTQRMELNIFALEHVEQYYFQNKSFISYDKRIQTVIMEVFIEETTSKHYSFDELFVLAEAIRKHEYYLYENGKDRFRPFDMQRLNNKLQQSEQLQQYRQSNGIDMEQLRYNEAKRLKMLILKNNQEEGLEVSVQNLDRFVEVCCNQRRIPTTYPSIVCNLAKLQTALQGTFMTDISIVNQHPEGKEPSCFMIKRYQDCESILSLPQHSLPKRGQSRCAMTPREVNQGTQAQQNVDNPEKSEEKDSIKKIVKQLEDKYFEEVADSKLALMGKRYCQGGYTDLFLALLEYDPYSEHQSVDNFEFRNMTKSPKTKILEELRSEGVKQMVMPFLARFKGLKMLDTVTGP